MPDTVLQQRINAKLNRQESGPISKADIAIICKGPIISYIGIAKSGLTIRQRNTVHGMNTLMSEKAIISHVAGLFILSINLCPSNNPPREPAISHTATIIPRVSSLPEKLTSSSRMIMTWLRRAQVPIRKAAI